MFDVNIANNNNYYCNIQKIYSLVNVISNYLTIYQNKLLLYKIIFKICKHVL